MKLGLAFANVGPFASAAGAAAVGRAAQAAGLDSVWTVEHVVVPAGYESVYPYSSSGKMPAPDTVDIPDPLVWLTWVAAHTESLKLATGIVILPQRNPALLAKECATLDQLSGGRLVLGIGVGWLAEEFAALGVSFAERGARTDEYIEALRELWSAGVADYSGRFVNYRELHSNPKPVSGTIPIVVGGHTLAAARRAGRYGDGFYPGRPTAADLAPLLEEMRRAAVDAGRDPDAIDVTVGGMPTREHVERFAEAGVHRFLCPPPTFDPAALPEALEAFVADVAPVL